MSWLAAFTSVPHHFRHPPQTLHEYKCSSGSQTILVGSCALTSRLYIYSNGCTIRNAEVRITSYHVSLVQPTNTSICPWCLERLHGADGFSACPIDQESEHQTSRSVENVLASTRGNTSACLVLISLRSAISQMRSLAVQIKIH